MADIAILVSTFERPGHLERCLASIEAQRHVDGRFEVVVTDDGSRDRTIPMLASLARRVSFPLRFTTHEHRGFQLARCRNEGVAATTAPYLLFVDGDCILPPDHLQIHLEERRDRRVIAGDCLRLDRATSQRIDLKVVRNGAFANLVPLRELQRLRSKAVRAHLYEWCRVPMRPRLTGNNIALWRSDFEQINGFDEQFVGWGLEDRDLQFRLHRIGVRARSILSRTTVLHLWHAPDPSFAHNNAGTSNLRYYRSSGRPTYCIDGLVKEADTTPAVPLLTRAFASLIACGIEPCGHFANARSEIPRPSM